MSKRVAEQRCDFSSGARKADEKFPSTLLGLSPGTKAIGQIDKRQTHKLIY